MKKAKFHILKVLTLADNSEKESGNHIYTAHVSHTFEASVLGLNSVKIA